MSSYVTAGKWIGMALLLGLGACSINAAPPAPAPVVVQQPAPMAPPGSVVVTPQ